MIEWEQYFSSKKTYSKNKISHYIIKAIGQVFAEYYSDGKDTRKARTILIKDALSVLGHTKLPGKPSYKVYANGLSEQLRQSNGGVFKNNEWLWDLHWYVEGEQPYTTLQLPLVMECEWNSIRKYDRKVVYSGIKYDFQKLLVANADLRLMIFNLKLKKSLDELGCYFVDNIKGYKNLPSCSGFLFLAFIENDKALYIGEFMK